MRSLVTLLTPISRCRSFLRRSSHKVARRKSLNNRAQNIVLNTAQPVRDTETFALPNARLICEDRRSEKERYLVPTLRPASCV